MIITNLILRILNICYNITYLYYYNNIYNNNLFYIHDAGVGDIVLYYTVTTVV